jgi:hypothetical protein
MAIETTISIKLESLQKLEIISNQRSISKSAVIREIIVILVSQQKRFLKDRHSTEYQVKNRGNYRQLHIYLSEPYFEHALDLRRFYRSSLSLLISEAISLYFDKILSESKVTDNYRGICHSMIYYETETSFCWKHFWGMPGEDEIIRSKNYQQLQ